MLTGVLEHHCSDRSSEYLLYFVRSRPPMTPMNRAMKQRVVSGMRPTGKLHLGHLVGALQNWVTLQAKYDCFYFVADWHALTSALRRHQRDRRERLRQRRRLDWRRPRSGEEHVLRPVDGAGARRALSAVADGDADSVARARADLQGTDRAADRRDLSSIGFLGYPLLQTADIIIYDAHLVPVGDDQVPHLELSREVVRRFNNFYPANLSSSRRRC